MKFQRFLPLLCSFALGFFTLVGCSTLDQSQSGTEPHVAKASLSVSPTSVSVIPGTSTHFTVSVSNSPGDLGQTVIAVDAPAGLSIDPSRFTLGPNQAMEVTVTVSGAIAISMATLAFQSPTANTGTADLMMMPRPSRPPRPIPTQTAVSWPFHMHFTRTDGLVGYSNFVNRYWTAFDPLTSEFFTVDSTTGKVFVLNSATQALVASIPVPGAFSVDTSSDGRTIWVGTQIGDVYTIDVLSRTISRRYFASQIGQEGFNANIVAYLADGRLALLGGQGGIPGVDGYSEFAIWNPVTNDAVIYTSQYGFGLSGHLDAHIICGQLMGNFMGFARTPDRSQVVVSSAFTDSTFCKLNVATGAVTYFVPQGNSAFPAFSPDSTLFATRGSQAYIYDLNTFSLKKTISLLPTDSAISAFSADGRSLLVPSASSIVAYDLQTGNATGWMSNFYVPLIYGGFSVGQPITGPTFDASNSNGLFAGPVTEGVAFVDTSSLQPLPVGQGHANNYVAPNTGPVVGGTTVTWPMANANSVYFGRNRSSSNPGGSAVTVVSPSGSSGTVDVYTGFSDGGAQITPEGFSYGPTVLQVTTNAATTDGGTGWLYGYGLGPMNSDSVSPQLQISIGGAPVQVLEYHANAYQVLGQPFPMQTASFAIPPGNLGTSSDVTVTTPSGTTTIAGAIQYLPAVQRYPLPGSVLVQGVYDPHRDFYYFTDASSVQIFWNHKKRWINPIPIPAPTSAAQRLWGISISPGGSKLAISDPGSSAIYLLNPDDSASLKTFLIAPQTPGSNPRPRGLAVNDQGLIFYTVQSDGSGYYGFYKIDGNTGVVTNYKIDSPGYPEPDQYLRAALSSDGARAYFNSDGQIFSVDAVTDSVDQGLFAQGCCYGDYDLAISGNNTQLEASQYFFDADLRPQASIGYNFREQTDGVAVYGNKLSPDGSVLFQPMSNGIDVIDSRFGNLRTRISLPIDLSQLFDALVSNGQDNTLLAIIGQSGDQGIAFIDLNSLTLPSPPTYSMPQEAQSPSPMHNSLPSAKRTPDRDDSQTKMSAGRPLVRHVIKVLKF